MFPKPGKRTAPQLHHERNELCRIPFSDCPSRIILDDVAFLAADLQILDVSRDALPGIRKISLDDTEESCDFPCARL